MYEQTCLCCLYFFCIPSVLPLMAFDLINDFNLHKYLGVNESLIKSCPSLHCKTWGPLYILSVTAFSWNAMIRIISKKIRCTKKCEVTSLYFEWLLFIVILLCLIFFLTSLIHEWVTTSVMHKMCTTCLGVDYLIFETFSSPSKFYLAIRCKAERRGKLFSLMVASFNGRDQNKINVKIA